MMILGMIRVAVGVSRRITINKAMQLTTMDNPKPTLYQMELASFRKEKVESRNTKGYLKLIENIR